MLLKRRIASESITRQVKMCYSLWRIYNWGQKENWRSLFLVKNFSLFLVKKEILYIATKLSCWMLRHNLSHSRTTVPYLSSQRWTRWNLKNILCMPLFFFLFNTINTYLKELEVSHIPLFSYMFLKKIGNITHTSLIWIFSKYPNNPYFFVICRKQIMSNLGMFG